MIYFITENWLKVNTPITANIDAVKIFPFVQSQSDMRIQPILGTYFYRYLLTAYNAQTLTPDEEVLVAKIQPAIEDCVLAISYALKNKGDQQQSGDYSQPVTFQEIAYLQNHYSQKAEFYERRIIHYLKENGSLFPEYVDALNNDSDIKPTKKIDEGFNDYFEII